MRSLNRKVLLANARLLSSLRLRYVKIIQDTSIQQRAEKITCNQRLQLDLKFHHVSPMLCIVCISSVGNSLHEKMNSQIICDFFTCIQQRRQQIRREHVRGDLFEPMTCCQESQDTRYARSALPGMEKNAIYRPSFLGSIELLAAISLTCIPYERGFVKKKRCIES